MKKREKGRPPFRAADRLSERYMLRFRPAERARLEAEARRAGLNLSTYLRHKILGKGE